MLSWSFLTSDHADVIKDKPHLQIDFTRSNDRIPRFSIAKLESQPFSSFPITQAKIDGAEEISNGFLFQLQARKRIAIYQSCHLPYEKLQDTVWLNITIVNRDHHTILTTTVPISLPASKLKESTDFLSEAEHIASLVERLAPISL
jgi:hypothetical protein